MSHELRTPLNSVLGFAQILQMEMSSAEELELIGYIVKSGGYLLELINEVLDISRVESGSIAVELEVVSSAELVRQCVEMVSAQAFEHDVTIIDNCDNDCYVRADFQRLKQVLVNLLSNAIKYNQVGGAVIVECSVSGPQRMRVSVTDTGDGLSIEKLAQLFQPFNRLGQEGSGEEGTGIGLVVTKRLVELMGGSIGVTSTIGKGSVFWIELVVAAAPQLVGDGVALVSAPQAQIQDGDALRTLLYVEDNPANLQLVERIVARRPDMRLLSARTGTLGIELARSARPDVILMDINLPGMSGIKAMQILRADTATAHIPVVALSANAMARDIERGLEAGFFRYLTKPIKVNEFLETLDVALEFARDEAIRMR